MRSPHLERKLKDVLGEDAGEELVGVIERIEAVRGDIAELRHETRSEFAAVRSELKQGLSEVRSETRLGFADVKASIEALRVEMRGMATKAEVADTRAALKQDLLVQSRWMIGLWSAILLAVIGLYGTVIALVR